ncbi:MAG: HAD-IIIC family phosphatase [Pseudomonadota bacterium]
MSKILTIGLAGSFTVDPLTRLLSKDLTNKGFEKPNLAVAPYNQIIQLSMQPEELLGAKTDILAVFWRLEDITADLSNQKQTLHDLDNFIVAIETLRANYSGTLIVSNPPYPSALEFNVHDLEQAETGLHFYNALLARWQESVKEIKGVKHFNLAGLLNSHGAENAHDVRSWYLYKQPYTLGFWKELSAQTARIIAAQTVAAKKCIVLDCDNTLWGGIIGEDGLGGIEIGQDFPGKAFADFQKYCLHLRSKGLFLAIASKNNEQDVFEVFDKHDAMVLKRDHISSWQVHWNSKAESIQAIANDLNIGIDACVFVDDNPKEIAEVKERLPEVECFIVPEEIAELPSLLMNTGLFDIAEISEEDKKRADMMLAETKRKTVATQMSEEEFRKSLDLKIDIFEAEPQHLGRVTQLINKTNQFNLTTIRRTQDEVESLTADKNTLVMGMDIKDRFGEYGLVGVAIIKKEDEFTWDIDSLMMSCRVLGCGAETSFLNKIAEAVSQKGAKILKGRYIETKKNALVRMLYPDHNFVLTAADEWVCNIDDIKPAPEEVTLTLKMVA